MRDRELLKVSDAEMVMDVVVEYEDQECLLPVMLLGGQRELSQEGRVEPCTGGFETALPTPPLAAHAHFLVAQPLSLQHGLPLECQQRFVRRRSRDFSFSS